MIVHPTVKKIMDNVSGKIIALFLLGVIVGCASSDSQSSSDIAEKEAPSKIILPTFVLPMTQNEEDKTYLGISGSGNFYVTRITSPHLIIEVFNMYCPHCQRSAPLINELYETIQARPDIKEKIKIIGIGIGNSPYEVELFKKKYAVPFPLFADQDGSIGRSLGAISTPTFIGATITNDRTIEQFYFKAGEINDATTFLEEILAFAELDKERSQ